MHGGHESAKATRQRGDAYKSSFDGDGTGNWSITLPRDISEHDFLALEPVIEGIKAFLAPTVAAPPEAIAADRDDGRPTQGRM